MNDLLPLALVAAGGVAMGFVNALAGGGGLIGLFVLQLGAQLLPLEANANLRPAALMIGLFALAGFRSRQMRVPPHAWGYGLATVPGALLGTHLALDVPEPVYKATLLAVVLVVAFQQLRPKRKPQIRPAHPALAYGLFVLVGFHMGFIQVAVGLLMIAALTRVHSRDLVEINTAKTALIICAGGTSTAHFAMQGAIDWPPALALASGAAAGSFFASRFGAAKGHAAIRIVVLCVCAFALVRVGFQLLEP